MADSQDYGKQNKRIVFTANDNKHAKFILKLKYDGFTQSAFFREVINAYIEENEALLAFINEIKPQSKAKKAKTKKLRQKGKQNLVDLALNDGEIENIFDILEQEFPDL
jgi:predicted DNA-binding protein|tara:strand:+ start:174 stop:500 length:327 start_codon:yes stop_codon:yes gene_type:complete